jgi:hypothetical protein
MQLNFPTAHRFVAKRTGHIGLLYQAEVWDQIERWLITPGS